VDAVTDTTADLSWTNGDTSVGTITEIWGKINGASSGACGTVPTGWAQIDEVGAGVDEYTVDPLQSRKYHCYAVRHLRNGEYSSWSNQVDDSQTALAEPTGLSCQNLATGVKLSWTNVESTGNVQIQRRLLPSGGFADLAAPANAGAGTQTYNDETCTCDSDYEYRVRAEEASWPDSAWSNVCSSTCCSTPPSVSECDHVLDALPSEGCPDPDNCAVTFTITDAEAGDTYKLLRSIESSSGSPVYDENRGQGSISNGQNTVYDIVAFPSGGDTRYLQYKVEIYEDGTTLVDNCETTEDTISIDSGQFCPE
jgi:hypothetical protein